MAEDGRMGFLQAFQNLKHRRLGHTLVKEEVLSISSGMSVGLRLRMMRPPVPRVTGKTPEEDPENLTSSCVQRVVEKSTEVNKVNMRMGCNNSQHTLSLQQHCDLSSAQGTLSLSNAQFGVSVFAQQQSQDYPLEHMPLLGQQYSIR